MAVTQGAALIAIRQRLDEATATAWTDAEIRGWINEAVADIARRTESIIKSATKSVVAGTQEYSSLASDLLRLQRVEYVTSTNEVITLELRELNELDSKWYGAKRINSGRPMYCGIQGYPPVLNLVLYPIPSESGATLKYYYYAAPTALATDTSAAATALDIPNGWEPLVYEYATYLAQRRDGQLDNWQATKRIYEEQLADMIDQTRHYHDQANYIVPERDYDAYGAGLFDLGGIGGYW